MPKLAQKWPKIAKMAQKWSKMAQKLAPAEKKIAQIYLQHLQLFASLWKYGTMEGNWPSFLCIQDTKHVEREARAVPHLPARLHRRRLPLLQQPQVLSRLLRQVSWCRCHEYNRNIVSYHSGKANSEEPWVQWFRNKTEVFSDHVCQISITYKTSYISN